MANGDHIIGVDFQAKLLLRNVRKRGPGPGERVFCVLEGFTPGDLGDETVVREAAGMVYDDCEGCKWQLMTGVVAAGSIPTGRWVPVFAFDQFTRVTMSLPNESDL